MAIGVLRGGGNGEDEIGLWNDLDDTWRLKCDMACDKESYSILAGFGV